MYLNEAKYLQVVTTISSALLAKQLFLFFFKNYVFNCVDIKVLVLLKLDMLT